MLSHKHICVLLYMLVQAVKLSSCEQGVSIAFAIDTTVSMASRMDQVLTSVAQILETAQESKLKVQDLVLVTFNDPFATLETVTTSIDEFGNKLLEIKPSSSVGNPDCAEMSLSGIETALRASRPGSYIFVFTDASAKDYYKLPTVQRLCQEKKSQVIFAMSGDCRNPSSDKFRVYEKIEAACPGQVSILDSNTLHPVPQ